MRVVDNVMTKWGFYGRKEELKRVGSFLRRADFGVMAIRGRRGIGKSELLAEGSRRGGGDPPLLMFELPEHRHEDQNAINLRLVREAKACLPASALVDLPDPDPENTGQMRFVEIIRHLLFQNVVVCLDEFHHASTEGFGLTSAMKRLIDASGPLRHPRPTGKLIIMGSHQQQFDALFAADKPLFGRINKTIALKQWRIPTGLGIAAKHGFLRNPSRFLTLWTAFGGIPQNWEAFASSDDDAERLRDFSAWPNDETWRSSFLDWQYRRLTRQPIEHFDDRSSIELTGPHREILLWLALNRPKGAMVREFPTDLQRGDRNPPLRKSLDVLSGQLELIEKTGEFYGSGECRWSVTDNNTLFQLSVFPDLFEPGGSSDESIPDRDRSVPLDRLETIEGLALERLAADWLSNLLGITYARQGVWRHRSNPPVAQPDGSPLPPLADIDVLGVQGYLSDSDPILFVGSCKCNPRRHDPARLDRQTNELLADLGGGEDAKRIRGMRRQRMLISPLFEPEHRRRYGESGHVCIDIPGMQLMAREQERNPNIEPLQLTRLADEHRPKMND